MAPRRRVKTTDKKRAGRVPRTEPAAASATNPSSAAPSPVRAFAVVPLGAGVVTLRVETTDLRIPFQVGLDGIPLMGGSFGGEQRTPLAPGTHRVTWHFNHIEPDWSHRLTVAPEGGLPRVLDARSAAAGDAPISIDMAVLVAG